MREWIRRWPWHIATVIVALVTAIAFLIATLPTPRPDIPADAPKARSE